MTHDVALAWAERWIDDWNRRDVEAVLAHFADDVEFCSPLVVTVTSEPSGIVRGRDALREYWTAALAERPDLHFLSTVARVARSVPAAEHRRSRLLNRIAGPATAAGASTARVEPRRRA